MLDGNPGASLEDCVAHAKLQNCRQHVLYISKWGIQIVQSSASELDFSSVGVFNDHGMLTTKEMVELKYVSGKLVKISNL